MLLDPDMNEEPYIEDCQVCCNPIQIEFLLEDDNLVNFSAVRAQ